LDSIVNFFLSHQINLMTFVIFTGFVLLLIAVWSKREHLHCTDLITSPDGRLSRTAIGQTLGILVAVWAPAYTTLKDKLDVAVLTVSLGYLGSIEAYAKFLRWKADQNKDKP
jgi:hypothetical protein